ncbi:TPA: fimbrial protein [Citrobacter koseri]
MLKFTIHLLASGLLFTPLWVNAGTTTATVTVKVTLVAPPPCVINDDNPIEVEFGDVLTTQVNGNNYRIPVNYTLSCTNGTSNDLKIKVQGNGADFDASVLRTNIAGLGIALQIGETAMPINSWLNFTYPDNPQLWAVPVKQAGATLTAGEFSAAATMKVDYQ